MVYQPRISDEDNNVMFGMESASVTLLGAADSTMESISVSSLAIDGLLEIGISVTGEILPKHSTVKVIIG